MKVAAISKLKVTISEYIGFVKAGEEVLVTERGKAVARIVPVEKATKTDAHYAALVRRGILKPGKGPVDLQAIRDLPISRVPDGTIIRVLNEDREESA